MKISKIILLLILVIVALLVLWFGFTFSPGSYANTPKYEFNVTEKQLLENINKLKEIDTTLIVPKKYDLTEGIQDDNDSRYYFYIYYSQEQEIVYCWVRANTISSSTLAVISIMNRNQYWNILEKNQDQEELEKIKSTFEERIVNRLKKLNSEKQLD